MFAQQALQPKMSRRWYDDVS